MKTFTDIAELRGYLNTVRRRENRIALVPTMGALHDGHLRLIDAAKHRDTVVVLSVFVNPLQFGPAEDFNRYPRDFDRDCGLAEAAGVDVLFAPSVKQMYPSTPLVTVKAGSIGERWEGHVRPGHFDGVLTVVAKLFNLVQPDVAWFGQKDIQQFTLIQRMVHDLDFPIDVRRAPTVRDADGLALSSRNAYLSAERRKSALALSRGLLRAQQEFDRGERQAARLVSLVAAELDQAGLSADYIALTDSEQLESVSQAKVGSVLALAVRVGSTRLIDNVILGE